MNVRGKIAIVTGVSKGIGEACVKALLAEEAMVIGFGRNDNKVVDDQYAFIKTNVDDLKAVERSMDEVVSNFGDRIDVLINNAGLGYFEKIEETEPADWYQMFQTNVHGIFHTCRQVIPLMKKAATGHIINVASIAGLTGIPGASGYCGTKHAVRGISHSLYKELRKKGIKVSCVYPGSVNTEFFDNYEGVTANESMLSPQDIANTIINLVKLPNNALTVDVEIRPLNPTY